MGEGTYEPEEEELLADEPGDSLMCWPELCQVTKGTSVHLTQLAIGQSAGECGSRATFCHFVKVRVGRLCSPSWPRRSRTRRSSWGLTGRRPACSGAVFRSPLVAPLSVCGLALWRCARWAFFSAGTSLRPSVVRSAFPGGPCSRRPCPRTLAGGGRGKARTGRWKFRSVVLSGPAGELLQ